MYGFFAARRLTSQARGRRSDTLPLIHVNGWTRRNYSLVTTCSNRWISQRLIPYKSDFMQRYHVPICVCCIRSIVFVLSKNQKKKTAKPITSSSLRVHCLRHNKPTRQSISTQVSHLFKMSRWPIYVYIYSLNSLKRFEIATVSSFWRFDDRQRAWWGRR